MKWRHTKPVRVIGYLLLILRRRRRRMVHQASTISTQSPMMSRSQSTVPFVRSPQFNIGFKRMSKISSKCLKLLQWTATPSIHQGENEQRNQLPFFKQEKLRGSRPAWGPWAVEERPVEVPGQPGEISRLPDTKLVYSTADYGRVGDICRQGSGYVVGYVWGTRAP